MFASIVLNTTPMLSVSWSRNDRCVSLNFLSESKLHDRLDFAFEQHRQDDNVHRAAEREPS